MTQAILAGGPEHGRRLELRDGVKEYVTVAAHGLQPEPAFVPARPPWWQPLRRRRWKPPAIPSPASAVQHAYRRDGQLGDGTFVYWHREGLSIKPPDEDGLHAFLVDALYAVPARDRMNARWVMDLDWYRKVRRTAALMAGQAEQDEDKWIPSPRDELLSKPVTVTEDGGVPHLEVSR